MKLTSFAKSAGCAGKLSPAALGAALNGIRRQTMPQILVGFEHSDDGGVYQLSPDLALVQTVDFFPPMVDDPYQFGQVAAANALSDIYAMGGTPITALSVVGFPTQGIDNSVLGRIMEGGLDTLDAAGVALMGGHSLRDEEVKFGYAITGTIHPKDIRDNSGARAADRVFLTKKLGAGLITTALKKGEIDPAHLDGAIQGMIRTNRVAAEVVSPFPVKAMTDVTGFGLIGHATEVARASGVTIALGHEQLPILAGAIESSARGYCAGGLHSNREFFGGGVDWTVDVPEDYRNLLFDPQTSGGLLIFAAAGYAPALVAALEEAGELAAEIGLVKADTGQPIEIG
jgi:selenide,water dikinase